MSPEALGDQALATVPSIWHAIVRPAAKLSPADFEHRLLLARKQFERQEREHGAYVPSFSSRTIVYKGLLLAPQVRGFYGDLRDPDYEVPLIVFHQRYSTNTTPTWHNAQPFRLLCHNGEINTLQGNLAWTRAREPLLAADFADAAALRPVIDSRGSDFGHARQRGRAAGAGRARYSPRAGHAGAGRLGEAARPARGGA